MATSAPPSGLDQAAPIPYWIDAVDAPVPCAALAGEVDADLLVVGGGYTGLWTALLAKEEDPARRVVLLEGGRCGRAASGRNGGFCAPSLTHGVANGAARWPREIDTLVRLGLENLREMAATIERHGIDAEFTMTGKVTFARTPWEARGLAEAVEQSNAHGDPATFLTRDEVRRWVDAPYIAGMHSENFAFLHPYKLALGLRRVCLELGVEVFEDSPVERLDHTGGVTLLARTAGGTVRARRVALATNAYRPLLRRLSLATIPVYDYALVTEPLSPAQFASIGWEGDHGFTDSGNQFHYARKTADGRILWGGYDAVYHFGSTRREDLTQRTATFETLARQFVETFPTLAGVDFTHRWGGIIDSSTRFCLTTGTAAKGRVAYALGYTGLGVAATRFGARVMLDLLDGRDTPRTRLSMVRRPALPFPPEPLRYLGVQVTRWSMARADRTGRRNPWLRFLDAIGVGFDS
jgi:glycine/D-amino acid oxidase-like deaminating enzyme